MVPFVIRPIENIAPYLVMIAIFEALVLYLYQYRKISGAILLVYCQVCKVLWILGWIFCSLSLDLPSKLFWTNFAQLAPILLNYCWFLFILEISQQKEWLPVAVRYFIQGIVVALLLVIFFDKWLGWYWVGSSLQEQILTLGIGPAGKLTIGFNYLLSVISIALSVRWVFTTKGLRRRHAIVLSITPLFTVLGNILGRLPVLQMISPQMIGLLLSGVYITWAFYRWRVYSILPLAQHVVIRSMIDGLLVVDEQDYIVEINPAAKMIFNDVQAVIGGKFQELAVNWPALAELDGKNGLQRVESLRQHTTGNYYYQLDLTPLKIASGQILGKVIVLKDITEQKQNHDLIIEQEKAFSILTERQRLGRELHDGQGQLWSYIHMQLEAINSLLTKKNIVQMAAILKELSGVVQNVHMDLRESITGLRTGIAAEQGIVSTLTEYLQWFQEIYAMETTLSIQNEFTDGMLTLTSEVQLLRIVQEALTNSRKHARAKQIKVIIGRNDSMAEIRVEDDGCGFDLNSEKKGRFGLKIMQERAMEIGGEIRIESLLNRGTTVIIRVPLEEMIGKGS